MIKHADRKKSSFGNELLEAVNEMAAFLRGEIELESYEVDDTLPHPRQTAESRQDKTKLERN